MPSHNPADRCMKASADCALICARYAARCLNRGDEHAAPNLQGALRDCVDVCGLIVDFIARGSEHAPTLCAAGAEVCATGADACRDLADEDEMARKCLEVCDRTAEACRDAAGVTVR